jgi:hypothetical protein
MNRVVLGTMCVVAVGAALTGCSVRDAAPSSPAVPSATSSSLPVVRSTTGLVKLPWHSSSSAGSDALVVSVENEDCVDPKGVSVEETATTVTVTAWGEKSKEPCAAVGYALAGALPLQSPLGDRKLEHG